MQVPSDEVFAKFVVHEVPAGLRGIIIAAILSAAMGTLSGSLNSIASAIVSDLYRPLIRPEASESHYLNVSRATTIIAAALQMAVAYSGRSFPDRSTVDNVLAVAAFTTGITLGVLMLGLLSSRATGVGAMLGMVVGAMFVTCLWAFTRVAFPWYALAGSSITLLTGLIVSHTLPPQGTATDWQRNS
jgi:Na+/proline symporter